MSTSSFSHFAALQAAATAPSSASSDSNVFKLATIVGLTSGLVASGLYYLIRTAVSVHNGDQMQMLRTELLKELR